LFVEKSCRNYALEEFHVLFIELLICLKEVE